MSNQLERLLFFIVVISGALCTVEDYVIMSQCAHNKAIHIAAEGTVSVTDTSQIQNITIVGFPDYLNNEFKIALYAKETRRYLCFNDNWRLVGMRELRDTCYFNETIVHGYFVFRSVVDLQRRVGFTHRGKPVGPKKSVNDACYMFNKIEAEQFFRHHHNNGNSGNNNGNGSGNDNGNGSNNSRKPPRNNKNNRHKSNNQNQKLQQQQEHHGHNNNNNNVILNNSNTSLSSTNKKQLAINRQRQQQQQHQVRHHHNDPSLLLRRQQHEKKQKRRKQQKQQQHQQRVSASPTNPMPATPTAAPAATPTVAATSPATATRSTTAAMSSKRKGRRRKAKVRPKAQQQQQLQLLATAATSPYTDDTLYGSSSSSSSTGFEDLDIYNSSSSSGSSSSLDPWSTWSTIDSFSGSSTTATSDDSISSSSSSNYDAWATYITEMEAEASAMTPEMGGNDTELMQYEAELVDDPEAESTATIETKATSVTSTIAATAATTTSTAGSQLVIEQTPLARSNISNKSSSSTKATPTATSQTETAQSTQQPSRHRSNSREDHLDNSDMLLAGENEVKPQQPRKLLWTVQPPLATRGSTLATLVATPEQQHTSTTATAATTPEQHVAPSLFSVDKNINSNLNNTLTEASPTATSTSSITSATTMKRPIRKFTKKLMATPYHQLTYVRNAGGDIDIDNLDNISVYPVLYDGDLEGNGGGNSSDGGFSGFLPTSTTSHLTEPIRIGMNRIRPNKTLHWFTHQRFA
uniref:Thisbe n=1 Tax=Drosophila melanogaster TaxID=7227 RepID=Q6Q7I9_DROME|nr:thisbe, isoform A [Drosophila melanogaster]AAF58621.2 thisbe, isoform A [Drosophila melanogaster]AAS90559.1 thisbe [Drosophila melanogaster]|eukprot:NP_610701.2 thisbe, isoform A [Drosophila melanogaster]